MWEYCLIIRNKMKEAINLLRIKYRINNRGIIEFDMFP